MDRQPGAAQRRAPFPIDREENRGGKESENESAISHALYDALPALVVQRVGQIAMGFVAKLLVPQPGIPHLMWVMPLNTEIRAAKATVRKASAADLKVGLICADRDGNRVRIDHLDIDAGAAKLSFHFLNDELRVQEGIQETSIGQFLSEGWYVATPGAPL